MRARLTTSRRVLGVDVARALALLGMMSVHIFPAVRADASLHPAYGIAVGRLDLRRRATALWLVVGAAALAVAAKMVSSTLLEAAGAPSGYGP